MNYIANTLEGSSSTGKGCEMSVINFRHSCVKSLRFSCIHLDSNICELCTVILILIFINSLLSLIELYCSPRPAVLQP